MTTEATIWTIAYLIVAFVCWVPTYRWFYRWQKRRSYCNEFNSGDRAFGTFYFGFICLCWPIFLPLFLVYIAGRFVWNNVNVSRMYSLLEKD